MTVIVQLPAATGFTENVALGPLPEPGVIVAVPEQPLVLNCPPYAVSLAVKFFAAAVPLKLNESGATTRAPNTVTETDCVPP